MGSPGPGPSGSGSRKRSSSSSYSARSALHSLQGSAVPVRGEAYCDCLKMGRENDCVCGEEDKDFEWSWDTETKSSATQVMTDQREVKFHIDYSCGTAAVRGTQPMKHDQYFWEVKMSTPVYGTDIMVGIGTGDTNLDAFRHTFCSLLGRDAESWGLSYTGQLHHRGEFRKYSQKFGQGSIIGIHLDMWLGRLMFYKNRKPLGLAFTGLQEKTIYPMVCSTAARSGMKIIKCCSFGTSLQFMCCQALRKMVPQELSVVEALEGDLPPGLKAFLINNLYWLLRPSPMENLPSSSGLSRSGLSRKRLRVDSSDSDSDSDDAKREKCSYTEEEDVDI